MAVDIRESRLSFGGIALSSAGIGLRVCGIRLRRHGIALPSGGSTLSLYSDALPLSDIRLLNSEVAWQQKTRHREQAPRTTVGNSNRQSARKHRCEFQNVSQDTGTEAIDANDHAAIAPGRPDGRGSGLQPDVKSSDPARSDSTFPAGHAWRLILRQYKRSRRTKRR